MSVRREKFLELAEMNASTFGSHLRNGDLPFELMTGDDPETTGRKWRWFGLDELARMIAAKELALRQGVTWSEAAKIIRTRNTGTDTAFFDHDAIFIARVERARLVVPEDPGVADRFQFYLGPMAEILKEAEFFVSKYNERATDWDKICIASVVSVNFSRCYRIAQKRFDLAGVDLSVDEA